MTLDSELEKKQPNGSISLYMSEWPEQGRIRRRWNFQRIGKDEGRPEKKEPEETVEKERVEVVEEEPKREKKAPPKKEKESPETETPTKPKGGSREKKQPSSETVMVEPGEKSVSSPLSEKPMSDMDDEKKKGPEKDSLPMWKRSKQARIEEEEKREFAAEQKREQLKKRKKDKPTGEKKRDGGGGALETKVDLLMEMVKELTGKVDGMQKMLSDEQRIRNSDDPQLPKLVDKASDMFLCLHMHASQLKFLDNYDGGKCDKLKKTADELRRLRDG